jgi:hypothetical protein
MSNNDNINNIVESSIQIMEDDKLKLKEELLSFETALQKKKVARELEKKTLEEKSILKKGLHEEMKEANKLKMTFGNKYIIKEKPLSNTRKPTQKIIRQAIINVVGEEKAHLIFKQIIYKRKEKLNACSKQKKLLKVPFKPKK